MIILGFLLLLSKLTLACDVRVDLPFSFNEHESRFRNNGFNVSSSVDEHVLVRGEYATGGVRLGRIIVFRKIRGEFVEVDRVNAQFLQGLPSQMIQKTIPIIQQACSVSMLNDSRRLCEVEVGHVKDIKMFVEKKATCDIFDLTEQVIRRCEQAGYQFCFPEVRDYEPNSDSFSFSGNNCRVEVSGKIFYSHEERRDQHCQAYDKCQHEIISNPNLNTAYRRESIQKLLSLFECDQASSVNQLSREFVRETTTISPTLNQSGSAISK